MEKNSGSTQDDEEPFSGSASAQFQKEGQGPKTQKILGGGGLRERGDVWGRRGEDICLNPMTRSS